MGIEKNIRMDGEKSAGSITQWASQKDRRMAFGTIHRANQTETAGFI